MTLPFFLVRAALLSTTMAEGDLEYLQEQTRRMQETSTDPEELRQAYEMAREMHPSAPSLKELLAWDRQRPLRSHAPPSE